MNEIFTIGDFCFRLVCPASVTVPDNFLKFRGGAAPAYTYTIEVTDTFPEPKGTVLARRGDILVLDREGLECRYIGVKGQSAPYACYMEESERAARILLASGRLGSMGIDPVFISLLALERRQMEYGGLVLHCAYAACGGEAILFSAPSGTGKSTQADLWSRYRGAQTINGDRALLQKVGGRWCARGWPVCGSSGICENRDLPIRAVVMLSQAPEDRARRLVPMQAFSGLYSEITVNRWNRESHLHAMELLEDLIAAVPVYHLACTMNESAVEALEAALGESR